MNLDIQTVKPRVRKVSGHWQVECPIVTILFFGTIDEALTCWRANRLHTQLNYPRWCAK
jgi:hypothetical protein